MPRSFPLRSTLTRRDRVVVRAIAEAMFSEHGEVDKARLDAHVIEADTFISAASKMTRFGLRAALLIVRLAPILLFFRFTTVERLPIGDRVALLARLERSRRANLSLAFIGWRTILTMLFYEDASELRAMGYAGSERHRYKRGLPMAPVVPLVAALPPVAPIPLESGVRLRGDHDSEAPNLAASDASSDEQDVA